MSDRGIHRGGGGDHRGSSRGGRGGRGNARSGSTHNAPSSTTERPKKENILDLGKYMDKQITVKFNGGREGGFLASAQQDGNWIFRELC